MMMVMMITRNMQITSVLLSRRYFGTVTSVKKIWYNLLNWNARWISLQIQGQLHFREVALYRVPFGVNGVRSYNAYTLTPPPPIKKSVLYIRTCSEDISFRFIRYQVVLRHLLASLSLPKYRVSILLKYGARTVIHFVSHFLSLQFKTLGTCAVWLESITPSNLSISRQ